MYQSRPENLFHYGSPNSLVNVILRCFLQVQDTRNDALVYARRNQFFVQFWRNVN